MGAATIVDDFGIGQGGPLRRFEHLCRLTTLRQQVGGFLLVAWVPILVLGAAFEAVTGWREPLLHDIGTHVRLLVAGPLFLLLDQWFPALCRRMLSLLARQGFVHDEDRPRFQRSLRLAARRSDSWVPEALLAGLSLVLGVAALYGLVPVRALANRGGLLATRVSYALVALPLYQFLLWRSLWRWAIWAAILFDVSRLNLQLVPTHPDRCGGIAFLRLPSLRYCTVLLFAVASVMCVEWSGRFAVGASIDSFRSLLLLFIVAATLVAVAPTLLFAPMLYRARYLGAIQIAELATRCGRAFERRAAGTDPYDLSRDEEVQGVAAIASTYRETVEKLQYSLFRKYDLYLLIAATTAPVFLVMIARVPEDDWMRLASSVFGGVTP